jgi:hypothetical protein
MPGVIQAPGISESLGIVVRPFARVRSRVVPLARQDVIEADTGVLKLSRDDQAALWRALQNPRAPLRRSERSAGSSVRFAEP